ncbi:MAG: hypothetical protein Ct9H300mP15_30180 [Gemmatimonadota bacterium]|nr:MAG: hypothetical protein Ct9H300mP15_30180 [Gemmatimonadota bacterium]
MLFHSLLFSSSRRCNSSGGSDDPGRSQDSGADPRKVVGRGRIREGQKSFIPLRVNSAGVMPIIFAQSFIVGPGTAAAFVDLGKR